MNLSNNMIGPEGATAMLKAATKNKNSSLRRLNLHSNKLGVDGGVAVADLLCEETCPLTELNVRGNRIGDEGATSMAAMIERNSVLTRLNLAGNGVGIEGLEAIAEAMVNNRTLVLLDLYYNLFPRDLRKKEYLATAMRLGGKRVVGAYTNYWQEGRRRTAAAGSRSSRAGTTGTGTQGTTSP